MMSLNVILVFLGFVVASIIVGAIIASSLTKKEKQPKKNKVSSTTYETDMLSMLGIVSLLPNPPTHKKINVVMLAFSAIIMTVIAFVEHPTAPDVANKLIIISSYVLLLFEYVIFYSQSKSRYDKETLKQKYNIYFKTSRTYFSFNSDEEYDRKCVKNLMINFILLIYGMFYFVGIYNLTVSIVMLSLSIIYIIDFSKLKFFAEGLILIPLLLILIPILVVHSVIDVIKYFSKLSTNNEVVVSDKVRG